jgi:hypothetical protein
MAFKHVLDSPALQLRLRNRIEVSYWLQRFHYDIAELDFPADQIAAGFVRISSVK